MRRGKPWGAYYHQRLAEIYKFLIAPGKRVIEIGCGRGDLLSALKPSLGVGIDFSWEMVRRAKEKHPNLRFIMYDAHEIEMKTEFDFVILSDLVNDLWDVQRVFERIRSLCTNRSRIIINSYSRLWELPLALAKHAGMANSLLPQNWLTVEDIDALLRLCNFEVIRNWVEIMWVFNTPFLKSFFNRILVKIWPFRYIGLTNVIVARPMAGQSKINKSYSVSVIIPARNEAGNIANILRRMPSMGRWTELIFVEGHSKDDTYKAIEKAISNCQGFNCKLLRQNGIGKKDAVELGFSNAKGELLMILDSDLSVPPESLPRFYDALVSMKGEFVNGVRLVYPMEESAMRFANLLGNKFFSLLFTWLLGQPVKDTLCGTKALWREDYEWILEYEKEFSDIDPFGDFFLLLGASKMNLKIIDVPIRYAERTYGRTNIQRWQHGHILLKMAFLALKKIKFV